MLIAASVLAIPTTWLMGRVTSTWYLAGLTATVWFLAGIVITLLSTLTGLFAEEAKRGKVFGILGLTAALGSLIGGSSTGPIADRWGYQTMFVVLAAVWTISALTGLLLQDRIATRDRGGQASTAKQKRELGRVFFLLLLAALLAGIAGDVNYMGRSVAMTELGFAAAAISTTAAIVQAVSLPLKPLAGWLSDRVGRKRLLALAYVAGTVSLLVLAASKSLWHFWVAASLVGVAAGAGSVGFALVADLLPPESLGVGMSLYRTTLFGTGIIGFAGTGHAIQNLGTTSTFIMAAFLRGAASAASSQSATA
jgi:MFS family permease